MKKMKRWASVLLILCMLLAGTPAPAESSGAFTATPTAEQSAEPANTATAEPTEHRYGRAGKHRHDGAGKHRHGGTDKHGQQHHLRPDAGGFHADQRRRARNL